MANYGDFSSLLQLGFGIGVGLSVFRAPVDLRIRSVRSGIEDERRALRGVPSPLARVKRRKLATLGLQLSRAVQDVEQHQRAMFGMAIACAAANLIALTYVSFRFSQASSTLANFMFVFIAVVAYLLIGLMMEVLARDHLVPLAKELKIIRAMV